MQTKFTDIVNNGNSVLIDISVDANSRYTMASTNIGNSKLPLSDQIEEWISAHSYKNL